jgi:excinuclease UvrABC nuclease subunit
MIEGFADVSEILRSGVYILIHKGIVIYIGKSKTMLNRIYTHRHMWGAKKRRAVPEWMPVKGILFDQIFVKACPIDLLDKLEEEMINLYKPKFNIRLKTAGVTTKPFAIVVNGISLAFNSKPALIERRV